MKESEVENENLEEADLKGLQGSSVPDKGPAVSSTAALVLAGMVCLTIVAVTWIVVGAFS